MVEWVEVRGKTVDVAVAAAMQELSIPDREGVDIEVIQEPEKGFLGLGGKDAIVRVSLGRRCETRVNAVGAVAKAKRGDRVPPRAHGHRENGGLEPGGPDPVAAIREGGLGERDQRPAKNNDLPDQRGKPEIRTAPGQRVGLAASVIASGTPGKIKVDPPQHERERQG